jgi:ribosomal protein L7/L12
MMSLKPTFPNMYANKINGIKYVRDQSALGIKESKDFVDAFMGWNGL